MHKSIIRFISYISVLLVIFISCTKEITDDIFNFSESFFTFQTSVDKNEVELDELVNFTLELKEVDLPSEYVLNVLTNGEGEFSLSSNVFDSGQNTNIEPGTHNITYTPASEGIHEVTFIITNANDVPLSLMETINISVGEITQLDPSFNLIVETDLDNVNEEDIQIVTEGNIVTVILRIIGESNNVPEDSSYSINFESSATGVFVFEEESYRGESQVVVTGKELVFEFTPEEIGEYDVKFSVISQFDETNICESAIFIVKASGSEIPVISLNGENPLRLTVGDIYVEEALVTDDIDAAIEIVFGGIFDGTTNTVGEFTRTYNAIDSDGNNAEEQIRTIIIEASDSILIETITILPQQLELVIGATEQLTTTFTPVNPSPSNTVLEWISSDPTIVSVNETGVVTGLNTGTVIITANSTDGSNITSSVEIEVVDIEVFVEEIIIQNGVTPMVEGQQETFTVLITPNNATNTSVLWSSANTSIATVNEATGLVTAISSGSTSISVETLDGSNLADTFNITVEDLQVPVEEIIVNSESFSLVQNGTQTIQYSIFPENATNQNVLFESENEDIVSVNENGLITALTIGETIINLSIEGENVATSITITVETEEINVESVTIVSESTELNVEDTLQLTANILPVNATNTKVIWISSNETVATVSDAGLVTRVSEGIVTISVETEDDARVDEIELTVQEPVIEVESIIINPITFDVFVGDDFQFTYEITPSNASNQTVSWLSNDTSVATVNNMGIVTAVGSGSTTIIVMAEDGSGVTALIPISVDRNDIPVTGVSISPTAVILEAGGTGSLTATITPSNATDQLVIWSSNDTDKVVIDSNGFIIGISPGLAVITVQTNDGDFTSIIPVTVNESVIPVTAVNVNPETVTLEIGETESLIASILPSNATETGVSWSSNNSNVVVSNTGVITAVLSGAATITVVTDDGGFTDTVPVLVAKPNSRPVIEDIGVSPTAGTTETVFTFDGSNSSDPDGDDLSYSWSDGSSVFSTSENATHIFDASGTYTVTLTVSDGNGGADSFSVTITVGEALSNVNDITSFTTDGQIGIAIIDTDNHTVNVEVSNETIIDINSIVLTVSEGATYSLENTGGSQNDVGVLYVVTAENGDEQEWRVSIIAENAPASDENDITSVSINGINYGSDIDIVNHTVTIEVPIGTALEFNLFTPTVSEGASYENTQGGNLDNGIILEYEVTAENGDVQVWLVTAEYEIIVVTEPSFDRDTGILLAPAGSLITILSQNPITGGDFNGSLVANAEGYGLGIVCWNLNEEECWSSPLGDNEFIFTESLDFSFEMPSTQIVYFNITHQENTSNNTSSNVLIQVDGDQVFLGVIDNNNAVPSR